MRGRALDRIANGWREFRRVAARRPRKPSGDARGKPPDGGEAPPDRGDPPFRGTEDLRHEGRSPRWSGVPGAPPGWIGIGVTEDRLARDYKHPTKATAAIPVVDDVPAGEPPHLLWVVVVPPDGRLTRDDEVVPWERCYWSGKAPRNAAELIALRRRYAW